MGSWPSDDGWEEGGRSMAPLFPKSATKHHCSMHVMMRRMSLGHTRLGFSPVPSRISLSLQ